MTASAEPLPTTRPGLIARLTALLADPEVVAGVVLTALAFVFHGALGVASAKARRFATGRGDAVVRLDRLQAAVFVGLALRLVFVETRPAG